MSDSITEQGIVIPPGSFDDRGHEDEQTERPPFKPLDEIEIPGLGKYTIGIPGTFNGKEFQLVAVDEDEQSIPILTYEVRNERGQKTFIPTENQKAVDFFGSRLNMDEVKKRFEPELDSWLKMKLEEPNQQ